jgi:hypothetical protein
MKTFIKNILLILLLSFSCQPEENVSPPNGYATFSFDERHQAHGRDKEKPTPAYVLLSLQGTNGDKREEIKLSLFSFGTDYLSEKLELSTGSYQLTQFVVLDSSNRVIYATPYEGSELSQFVLDPLPIEFIVGNVETQITPQVLAIQPTDNPGLFGYTSFGFDAIARLISLNLQIHHPDSGRYDSAYIVFKNSTAEIKRQLILDNSSYTATGIAAIPPGNWNISTSFFSTIEPNYESLEKTGQVNLDITPSATDLITTESVATIKGGNNATQKSLDREEYYYYQLYLSSANNTIEGFVRLPKDPTSPFVEIRTFRQKWTYAYVDRSFYNSSSDGTSNFFQGVGAFEIYGRYGKTNDRLSPDIIDTTSLSPGISEITNKEWNFVDAVIIVVGTTPDQELLLYHVWDFKTSGSRISSTPRLSTLEIKKRKRLWTL